VEDVHDVAAEAELAFSAAISTADIETR